MFSYFFPCIFPPVFDPRIPFSHRTVKIEPYKYFVAQLQVNILSSSFHIPTHSTTNRKQHHLISWVPQSSGIILTVDFCTEFSTDDFTLYIMPTCKLIYTFWTHWSSSCVASLWNFFLCVPDTSLPFHVFSLKMCFTYTFKNRQSRALYQKLCT